ncbi:MAG: hypothetical protein LBL28_03405 [Treponema sp.]|nr:hypothetical protein [Treponema sp.]
MLTGIVIFTILILSIFIYITMPKGKLITSQQSGAIASVVKEGDIICRLGDRLWSRFFRDLSLTDKRYSHIGIVHINDGVITVINAEGGTEHERDFVNESTLSDFLNVAMTAGIYRIKNTEGDKISALAREYIGTPFDWQFDMHDESKLYCTELLYVVLKRLLPDLKLSAVYIKALGREIILPEAISGSEYFSEVYFSGGR